MNLKSDDNIERSKDKDIQASLTLNQLGNSDKYWMHISDFSNYVIF